MITELGGSDSDQLYPQVTVDALPDDVLLEIFDFYLLGSCGEDELGDSYGEDAWQTLVHVCKKWRYIVFAAPQGLRLRLSLHKQKTRAECTEYMAGVTDCCSGPFWNVSTARCEEHHFRAQAARPRVQN